MSLASRLPWQLVNHELTSHRGQALGGAAAETDAWFAGLRGVMLPLGPSVSEDQLAAPPHHPTTNLGGRCQFVTLSGTETPSSLLRDEATPSPWSRRFSRIRGHEALCQAGEGNG